MESKILLLNLADQKNPSFEDDTRAFMQQHQKDLITVSSFSDYDPSIFKTDTILKVILYFDLSDINGDELCGRLIEFNQVYAPFHELVYILDNEITEVKKVLKEHFLYSKWYSQEALFSQLEEDFEEEGMIELAETDLYPIWQNILKDVLTIDPQEIENISSDANSVYMRGVLLMKKRNRRTAFEILKNLYLSHRKYFPVIELLKEFDDMKDSLPKEFYLNYKLFNKIKQGRINYLQKDAEKKQKNVKQLKLEPNKDKSLRKSSYTPPANVDKTLKTYRINYKDFADLKKQLANLKKLSVSELKSLNMQANNLSRDGKFQDSIAIYMKILKNIDKEKKYKILLNIAITYKRVPDWKNCLQYAQKTLEEDPDNQKATNLVIQCENTLGVQS